MRRKTPSVFDGGGGWITHSVELLTHLAEGFVSVPGEVLIMDSKAFSLSSWEQESVNAALEQHGQEGTKDWVYNFSDAYFLHKVFNYVENLPGYNGVNVPYIMARDSNYALASWPVVMV